MRKGQKSNEKRLSSIGLTSFEKNPYYPFPFPNSQKSFPLTPATDRTVTFGGWNATWRSVISFAKKSRSDILFEISKLYPPPPQAENVTVFTIDYIANSTVKDKQLICTVGFFHIKVQAHGLKCTLFHHFIMVLCLLRGHMKKTAFFCAKCYSLSCQSDIQEIFVISVIISSSKHQSSEVFFL